MKNQDRLNKEVKSEAVFCYSLTHRQCTTTPLLIDSVLTERSFKDLKTKLIPNNG